MKLLLKLVAMLMSIRLWCSRLMPFRHDYETCGGWVFWVNWQLRRWEWSEVIRIVVLYLCRVNKVILVSVIVCESAGHSCASHLLPLVFPREPIGWFWLLNDCCVIQCWSQLCIAYTAACLITCNGLWFWLLNVCHLNSSSELDQPCWKWWPGVDVEVFDRTFSAECICWWHDS